jgi:hypothetical protein
MARLPVVATIRDAYLFTLHHLGAVIGLIWVPMLVLTVTGFFSMQRYYNDLIDALSSGNAANLGPSILMMLGYLVAALLLYAVILVSVVQLALGQRTGSVMAHFSFGALEWRMFRALASLFGLALMVMLTVILAGNAALALASGSPHIGEAQGGTILLLVVYFLLVAGAPRFLMLLPAVAVAETGPALRRCWALSAGNFWRLLAVLVAMILPVMLVFTAAEAVLSAAAPPLDIASEKMLMISGLVRARQVLPLMSGLSFLFSPFLVALFCGASISAWRALKGEQAEQAA